LFFGVCHWNCDDVSLGGGVYKLTEREKIKQKPLEKIPLIERKKHGGK